MKGDLNRGNDAAKIIKTGTKYKCLDDRITCLLN